ncbi:hypothetical protein KAR91_25905 [Candidatus Pacearchaeota archaeon]|nr:hypothetical protein [Candidatus Pacearchaeota archaeon]
MADSDPKNSISINGSKYRSFEKPDTYWTDPLVINDFFSRTFLPTGTKLEEDQEEAAILNKVKNKKFKASDLSEDTQKKFKDENIDFEDDQGEDDDEQ